jgi:hypothetical protein
MTKNRALAGILAIPILCIFLSCNAKTNKETGSTQERAGIPDTPMNKMDIGVLFLTTRDGTSRFRIEGDRGFYSSEYGMNDISISFTGREAGSDLSDFYRQIEMYADGNLDRVRFPLENDTTRINVNRRKNIKNDIIFVDSFVFGGVQDASPQLMRRVYFTTNNYFIAINISARMPLFDDLFWQGEIADKKIPYYEKADPKDLRPGSGVSFVFNGETVFYHINAERFGSDMVNRRHPTQEIIQWYDETERILGGLRIEGLANTGLLLNGTWLLTTEGVVNGEMTLDNGNFEYYGPQARFVISKGVYTVSGSLITFTITHSWGGPFDLHYTSLYSKDEVKLLAETSIELTDENFDDYFPGIFTSSTAEYFPDDDIWITEKGITYRRGEASARVPEER